MPVRVASGDSGVILAIHPSAGRRSGASLRVLITGAGAGVGYACARAFAELGADLILTDINGQALEQVTTEFGVLGRYCDVASEASVAVFTAEVLKFHASLDVLINAAGRSYVRNLGTMRITRAFLPMMKSDGGKKHIVNIASMGGATRSGCHFPYAASQEAFDRLSDALAENVRGTKIALITVVPRLAPGGVRDGLGAATAVNVESFECFDPARVAAAVLEAVQSGRTVPGQTNMLSGSTMSHGSDQSPVELRRDPLRKLGN